MAKAAAMDRAIFVLLLLQGGITPTQLCMQTATVPETTQTLAITTTPTSSTVGTSTSSTSTSTSTTTTTTTTSGCPSLESLLTDARPLDPTVQNGMITIATEVTNDGSGQSTPGFIVTCSCPTALTRCILILTNNNNVGTSPFPLAVAGSSSFPAISTPVTCSEANKEYVVQQSDPTFSTGGVFSQIFCVSQ